MPPNKLVGKRLQKTISIRTLSDTARFNLVIMMFLVVIIGVVKVLFLHPHPCLDLNLCKERVHRIRLLFFSHSTCTSLPGEGLLPYKINGANCREF